MNTEELSHTLQEKGSELASNACCSANQALSRASETVRKYPWLVIGGAVVAGAVIAALIPRPRREPTRMEAVRDWLRETYEGVAARVPDRDDVQAAVQSTVQSLDLPGRLDDLRKKLHLR